MKTIWGVVDAEYRRFRGRKKSHLCTLRSFPITSIPVYISSISLHCNCKEGFSSFIQRNKELKSPSNLVTLSKYSNTIESLLGATALMTFSSIGRVSFAALTKDVLVNLVEIQIHFCLLRLLSNH